MKKLFYLILVTIILLPACSKPSEKSTINDSIMKNTDGTESEAASMSTFDHQRYTVDYPKKLTPEEVNAPNAQSVNFKDASGKTVMLIMERKGDVTGEYLEGSVVVDETINFQDGVGKLAINKAGYCDGPGCSPPFITYSIYDGRETFNIFFYNLTEESKLSKKVVASFKSKTDSEKMKQVELDFEEGYSYENPEWAKFKADIEKQTGEALESINAPTSPSTKDVIFVSTSNQYDQDTQKQVNKIYAYEMLNKKLTELYQEEKGQVLRTIGREGNHLIVLIDGIDNSPGPCSSGWYKNYKYSTLDIQNPSAGLTAYSLPQNLIELGEKREKECMEKNEL